MVFLGGKGGGTLLRHGHKESYKDLNLKNSTSEWDSNPRPHALTMCVCDCLSVCGMSVFHSHNVHISCSS